MSYDIENFKKEQPVLAELFTRARLANRLGHAFLLYGEPSAPVLESAMFLAESLGCEKGPLACRECNSCKRFEQGTHPDFMLIDGTDGVIKKDDVDEISDFFAMTSFEKGHRGVYIINHIENITEEAINALLKTLEEPAGDAVAFLTTTNRDKVLPTILSRCEAIQINAPDLKKTMAEYRGTYAKEMYYIAANLAYSEPARKAILDSDEFLASYRAAYDYLKALAENPSQAGFVLMREAADVLKGNTCYNYFYTVLSIVFSDVVAGNDYSPYNQFSLGLTKYNERLALAVALLDKVISQSQANMNFTFALARLQETMEGTKQNV